MSAIPRALIWIACAVAAPGAGEPETRDVVVEDDSQGPQMAIDREQPGFATSIDLTADVGARPADGLPEVLARSPGVAVRSIGGLGQFSSISIRGSSAQQVPIFWDGVPISGSLAGLVDLSSLPLDGLERVIVYKGYVPVTFGSSTMGGAVDLVAARNRRFPTITATGGLGSFGAHEARLQSSVPLGDHASFAARLGLAGAGGDFPFYDDGGTPAQTSDDGTMLRTNNDYRRVFGQVRFEGERRSWTWSAEELVSWKEQGIPGSAANQSTRSSLDSLAARTIASIGRHGLGRRGGGELRWLGSFAVDRRLYRDPLGEIGLAIDDQRSRALDGYLSPRLGIPLWNGAKLGLVGSWRGETVDVDEFGEAGVGAQASGDARRGRWSWGAGIELEQQLFHRHLAIVPAVHVDALDNRFSVAQGEGEVDDQGRDRITAAASPRLALRVVLVDGVEIRASGGRYFRPPTLLELFGDRGYMIGNEGLASEYGNTVDAGLVLDLADLGSNDVLDLYAHVAGFHTRAHDLIQWVQTGPVVQPTNVEGARLQGIESSVSLSAWDRALALSANYSFTHTANLEVVSGERGRSLPGRPAHQVFARGSSGGEFFIREVPIEPRVFYTFEYLAGAYLDPSERFTVGPRVLHGIGTELHLLRRLHLAFEIRNLLDTRITTWDPPGDSVGPLTVPVSDYLGYPLPGRSLWGSVRLDLEVPRRRRRSSAPRTGP